MINKQTGPSNETRSRERPETCKFINDENEQSRASNADKLIEAARAKGTEEISVVSINENVEQINFRLKDKRQQKSVMYPNEVQEQRITRLQDM